MGARPEEGTTLSDELVTHVDNCLGCMACVTACPSGVQYDLLVEDAGRRSSAATRGPGWSASYRRLIFNALPAPRPPACARPDAVVRAGSASRSTPRRCRVGTLAGLAPEVTIRHGPRVLPKVTRRRARAARPSASCRAASSACSSATSTPATRRVLVAEGFEVYAPPRAALLRLRWSCTSGEDDRGDGAREGDDRRPSSPSTSIITNAAGCGSAMKDYAHALRQESGWAERARRSPRRSATSPSSSRARGAGGAPPGRPRPRRLPRRLPPRPRPGHPRAAARAAARDPRAGGRRPRRLGDLLRSAGIYNLTEPRGRRGSSGGARPENLRATGAEADRRGQPRLRAADQLRRHRAGRAAAHPAPDRGARGIHHREEPDHIMSTTSTSGVTLHGDSTLALIINSDLWGAAGLTEDDIPTTWEELDAVSAALTTDSTVGLAFGTEYQRVGTFMAQAGGGTRRRRRSGGEQPREHRGARVRAGGILRTAASPTPPMSERAGAAKRSARDWRPWSSKATGSAGR